MFIRRFIPLVLILVSLPVIRVSAQPDVIRSTGTEGVCYGSNEVRLLFIPPPKSFSSNKAPGDAEIEVTFVGFPQAPKDAFNHALAIWSSLLSSDVKIRIRAQWTQMSEATVLASASTTSYYRGSFINAQNPEVYYAVALAEKIAARELNDVTEYDIEIRFNSAADWFYGLNGSTPATNYDFVTVALHELCHGLGFADSFDVTESEGSYGLNGIPVIYDTFVKDNTGKNLTNKSFFTNPSPALKTVLTSNALFFSAPLTLRHTGGSTPALYAPGTWDSGSSVSHLNETGTAQINALMTPFVAKGEAIHDPGLLTMSIMGDLGWINTRIVHTPVEDSESNLDEVTIAVNLFTDALLKKNGLKLFFARNGSITYDSVIISDAPGTGSFSTNLEVPAYNTLTNYYLAVSDTFGRVWYSPSAGRNTPHSFFVGTDTVPPVISHRPLGFILSTDQSLTITAKITDNLYPVSAVLEYKLNNLTVEQMIMTSLGDDLFSASINTTDMVFGGIDTIFYRITASDQAMVPNSKIFPSAGFTKLPVYSLFEPVEYYFNPFSLGNADFLMEGFEIAQPAGFTNPALHTRHPYESPELTGDSIGYYAILRHPIIVDSSGLYISFKEIVLIEPGEPGFPFGSPDFFDYVIVEASKSGEQEWTPLIAGYDSRSNPVWLEAYNNSISGQNSTYVPTSAAFFQRTIVLDTSSFIDAGDTLLIRFRLFSDPFAYGWGWAIDDLFIKAVISSSEKTVVDPSRIWPNPGNGRFTLKLGQNIRLKGTSVRVTDLNGRTIKLIRDISDQTVPIDISGAAVGVYTVIIESDSQISAIRYLLINK
jgi:hypothetical protein